MSEGLAPALHLRNRVDPVRLVTLHPVLVHFAIGTLPIALVAYAIAAARHSERWTFVGDVAIYTSAGGAVASAASGVVSFLRVAWVGSSGSWRWVHLACGAAGAALLVAIALARWRARGTTARARTFAFAAFASAVIAFTGWLGGEVLVFRGGAGVIAAADGALAPAVGSPHVTRSVLDVMDRVREHWATITVDEAELIAVAPTDDKFAEIRRDAEGLASLSTTLDRRLSSGNPDTSRDIAVLGEAARALAKAASRRDIPGIARELGTIDGVCARCHDQMR